MLTRLGCQVWSERIVPSTLTLFPVAGSTDSTKKPPRRASAVARSVRRANRASSPFSSGSLAPVSNRLDDSPWRMMNAVTTGWPSSSVPCTVYSDEPFSLA